MQLTFEEKLGKESILTKIYEHKKNNLKHTHLWVHLQNFYFERIPVCIVAFYRL